MPAVIPFIPAIIGGVSSVVGGVVGSRGASKAEQAQVSGATQARQEVTAAGQEAANSIDAATNQAIDSATLATNTGIGTVNSATQQANERLAAATAAQTANQQPYIQAGQQGVQRLGEVAGGPGFSFDAKDLKDTPGYQFTLDQGLQAIQRSRAARGAGDGGALIKEATRYATGLADTTFGQAYTRAENTFNKNREFALGSARELAGLGQTAVGNLNANIGTNYGREADNTMQAGLYGGNAQARLGEYTGNARMAGAGRAADMRYRAAETGADYLTQVANARAAGSVGRANAWTGATRGLGQAAIDGYYSRRGGRSNSDGGYYDTYDYGDDY